MTTCAPRSFDPQIAPTRSATRRVNTAAPERQPGHVHEQNPSNSFGCVVGIQHGELTVPSLR